VALCGQPAEALLPSLRGPEFLELERGRVEPEAFFAWLGQRLGLVPEQVREAWSDIFEVDQAMARLMERLAARYPVYLWSNSSAPHLEFLRPRLPVLERFRGLHLSYELGAIKPEPLFYERALAAGRLRPQACVFIDDVEANLAGARALGIHTVLHTSAAATEAALAGLGISA
jgi:putative hydrolase of the HAD superfamily